MKLASLAQEPAARSPAPGAPDGDGQAVGRRADAWLRAGAAAGVAWIASRLAYAIVTWLNWRAGHVLPPNRGVRDLLDVWLRWDTGHYVRIAQHGYHVDAMDPAFFPLYPLLIRAADAVLPGRTVLAALAVSNVAAFAALALLHRLASYELDAETADRSLYYLVAFPTGFFLAAGYNHSLFLALSIGALYSMRRGRWWVAGALGAFASATRIEGLLLILPFVYEYLRQKDFRLHAVRLDAAAVTVVPAGLVAYAGYCWYAFGDPLEWSHAQAQWRRAVSWPGDALWRSARELISGPLLNETTIVNAVDLTATLAAMALLVLCLVGPWRLRRDQMYLIVFGATALLLPLSVPATDHWPLISVSRHVLGVLPIFLILGRLGVSRTFDRIYVLPAVALQGSLLLIFLHYDWVA